MQDDLQENLRFLCAEKPSVAGICRDIGINHQQFSKYLSGRTRPSAGNLRRISKYFDLSDDQLLAPHPELRKTYQRQSSTLAEVRRDPFATAFLGDLPSLRKYLGAYQIHFLSPASPGSIFMNAMFLDERGGMVYTRLIEHLRDVDGVGKRRTRCDGKASYQGGRIFVIDHERQNEGAFDMSILIPPHRQNRRYLFGTMCFLASQPRRTPHASRTVWKRFDSYRSARELIKSCGLYAGDSRRIDPVTRSYLLGDSDGLPHVI